MYKMVIGNVKISVLQDDINKNIAIEIASKQIVLYKKQNKFLEHIEISKGSDGLEVKCIEGTPRIYQPKTLRQSMMDALVPTMKEKYASPSAFAPKDAWRDTDTCQEWRGDDVVETAENILQTLAEWVQSQKK